MIEDVLHGLNILPTSRKKAGHGSSDIVDVHIVQTQAPPEQLPLLLHAGFGKVLPTLAREDPLIESR